MDLADLRETLGPGQPDYRAKQLYEAIYRGQAPGLARVSTLPAALRQDLAERYSMGLPEIARRYESTDGTRRYLLRLEDGRTVETVLMPEGRRDTICISSQVGCAVDCRFCMTALLGLERNLTAGEIVGQVLVAAREKQAARLNIVMMGQGEPLLNLENVIKPRAFCSTPPVLDYRRAASRFPPPESLRASPISGASRCAPSWPFRSTPPLRRCGSG